MKRMALSAIPKELLLSVAKPGRYVPLEINTVHKDIREVRLKFALAFPDLYEIGMSHYGLQVLYHVLNQREDILCELAFCPWVDMQKEMKKRNLPLASHESGIPLSRFDIVGFSLQYELCYTNVLAMLDLAGIPKLARHRGEEWPVVIAGGPCCYNPEPMADFFDAVAVGDGEELILEIADSVIQWKEGKGNKRELLETLARIPGIYVPTIYKTTVTKDGFVVVDGPLAGAPEKIKSRVLPELKSEYFPAQPVVPSIGIVHDRLSIEISRGCTRGCRFCLSGNTKRPVRERNPEDVVLLAETALGNTGHDEVSLLSLSAGDYTCLTETVKVLMDRLEEKKVALSLPSLYVGSLTEELMQQIKRVRKTGFTLAPEAATEKLRKIINKDISEEALLNTARAAFETGWNLIKLYFMIGLPGETDDDVAAIADLAARVASKGRGKVSVNLSVSAFVPKPHTPFQWEGQADLNEIIRKQSIIKGRSKDRKLSVKWHDPGMSMLEGILSRGDRRLGKLISRAYELGCRFDEWTDMFKLRLWQKAMEQCGISPQMYLGERDRQERLPWDHIFVGVEKTFLLKESEKAKDAKTTPDCRWHECQMCGACNGEIHSNSLASCEGLSKLRPPAKHASTSPPIVSKPVKYRVRYKKEGPAAFAGHLDTIRVLKMAIRRAGIKAEFTAGFHPQLKISFGPALSLGIESEAEYFDITTSGEEDAERLIKMLNSHLPTGFAALRALCIPLKAKPPSVSIAKNIFVVEKGSLVSAGAGEEKIYGAMKILRSARNFEAEAGCHQKSKKDESIQACLEELSMTEDGDLQMGIKSEPGCPGPYKVVAKILDLDEKAARTKLRIRKTEAIFKNPEIVDCPASS